MSNDHRYNPVIARRLSTIASARDWDGLTVYLEGLSNSQFRTASYILSDETLRRLDNDDFWACFDRLVPTNRKAFLTTFLKAAVSNYVEGRLKLNHAVLSGFVVSEDLAESVAPAVPAVAKSKASIRTMDSSSWFLLSGSIDVQKTLMRFLPVLRTIDEVEKLFSDFRVNGPHQQIAYLLKQESVVCLFVLFQLLRKLDHEPEYLTAVCLKLMHRGTDRDFNLVSIVKCYFDLPQVRGRFSLNLNAYELSRLDRSFDEFRKIINRI